jgi:alkylhydroperoxidase family enzyme
MNGTARVPEAEITGVYGGLLKVMVRRMVGSVPDSVAVMWNHPPVFKDMMKLGRKVEKWDCLDRDLASFAHMAAASFIGCSACLDINYFMTHQQGLDLTKAREVPRWRQSDVFSPLERRVMEYAEAMCVTPLAVTDEMSAALLDDLGADALVELTARIGFMNASARSNIALGIRSAEFADACGLPPLAPPPAAVGSRT